MIGTDALAGKRAVVTGGGKGIGRAEVLTLSAAGARVVVNYSRSAESAERLVREITDSGGEAHAVRADIADVAQIAELMERSAALLGGIDILCSNAGIEHFGDLADVTADDFDRIFAVNTRGQFFAVQQAVARMGAGGRVLCTSSISATSPFPGHAVYSGSKAAVESMVRCLALDLAASDITINAIAAGGTNSDMSAENAHKYETDLVQLRMPEDIAKVVRFLVSPDAGWITGQTIRVAGGQ
jgi:NAD(P)-dependent dehydrogenase (short-subunit alcohol dehydrogenase family)